MNYIVDNTIANPDDATGYTVGSNFLIPTTGGEGDWAGHADEIATWGGSTWSFSDPAEDSEYQVTDGPNVGHIYKRTGTPLVETEFIPNSSFLEDPDDFPEWALFASGGTGVATWITGGGNSAIDLEANGTTDTGSATVTVDTVAGQFYDLTWGISNVNNDAPAELSVLIRDEVGLADIETLDNTETEAGSFTFQADSASTSIRFRADSVSGGYASMRLDYVSMKRRAECVTNGGFEGGLTDWTVPAPPWESEGGYPAPMSGDFAFGVIDYPGHTPLPALEQELTGLTAGQVYRIDFDAVANWTRGILSLYFDDVVLGDVGEDGHHTFYFKASASTHNIQFPLTKIGISDFEVQLDNVTMQEALWYPSPLIQSEAFATSTGTMGLKVSRALHFAASGTSTGTMALPANRALSLAPQTALSSGALRLIKSHNHDLGMSGSAQSSAAVRLTHSPLLQLMGSATSSGTVTLRDPGYYTVPMAVASILSLWTDLGCPCPDEACSPIQNEALERLNAAIQKLHASGKDWGYVSTVARTIEPLTGETEIILPRDVMHVKRCVFRPALDVDEEQFGKFPLRPLRSRHEVEAFRLSTPLGVWPLTGAETSLTGYQLPLGYFTEAEDPQDGSAGGPPALRLLLAPEFTESVAWKVDLQVAILPPRYVCRDIMEATRLHIPNRYAESLLMPLARYYALSSRYFRKPELRESVIAQAADVLALLGELQPSQPEADLEPKPRR